MTQNPSIMHLFLLNAHRATLECPETVFHLYNSPSPRRLAGQQVTSGQTETRSAYSSEVCKEVWSQCQPKSYLLDPDRKGLTKKKQNKKKGMCPHGSTVNNLYYQSSCMLCDFPLLLIFYSYLSVSLVP